jgi:hypothetical protein
MFKFHLDMKFDILMVEINRKFTNKDRSAERESSLELLRNYLRCKVTGWMRGPRLDGSLSWRGLLKQKGWITRLSLHAELDERGIDDVDVADKERFHLKGLVVLSCFVLGKLALQTWAGEQMAFPSWRRWPSQASDPDEEPQSANIERPRMERVTAIAGGCWIQWARSPCIRSRRRLVLLRRYSTAGLCSKTS